MALQNVFVLVLFLLSSVLSLRINQRDLETSLVDCYDYIIVGGGISGLVVANRLTEDPDVTVLVLESGPLDNNEDFIMNPGEEGMGLGSIYDWNLGTDPQTHLDGAARSYNLGRGIGGSSLINGMCWIRGGQEDYDAWKTLGNDGWGWDDLLPYFKKTENYSDNFDADFKQELYIQPNLSVHGSEGYVHVSYPSYFYNQSRLFLEGLQELGVPILTDPNNGEAAGGMLIPNTLDPDNQTRSNARTSYFDGFIDTRPNFHVAHGQLVIKLVVDSQTSSTYGDPETRLQVSGVQFVTDGSLDIHTVACSRDVILAAGAIHSPQLLELSGIGSADVLNELDIPVEINLPGVGNNFQDHPYIGVTYSLSNSSYITDDMIKKNPWLLNEAEEIYYISKTGPLIAGALNTVAFPSLQSISANWTNMMIDASTQNVNEYLPPDLDSTVLAGYAAQKLMLVALLSSKNVGAYELLNDNIGFFGVATMHPFSRGTVHIQSTNPLQQPSIDPRYCSNPLDCQVLVEGLLFNNKLVTTEAMQRLQLQLYSPFLQNATSETLMPAIRTGVKTAFHGTGTTSMLPREYGGVVDTHLRVYGTRNLRVVDAGIFPLVPASHLQAPVYAVAEKAADIIKEDNGGKVLKGCSVDPIFNQAGRIFSNSSAVVESSLSSESSTYSSSNPSNHLVYSISSVYTNNTSNTSAYKISSSTALNTKPLRPPFKSFPEFINSSFLNATGIFQNSSDTSDNTTTAGRPLFTLAQGPDPIISVIAAAASVFLTPTILVTSIALATSIFISGISSTTLRTLPSPEGRVSPAVTGKPSIDGKPTATHVPAPFTKWYAY